MGGGTSSKFLYTGQEKDLETDLNYYNYRYYDSHIRRFTQPDDMMQDPYSPQSLNRYSYVNNNPLKYTDPSGHFAWIPLIIIGTGGTLGATEAISSYSIAHPDASWQEKALVGAGGFAIGAGASAATLYVGTSIVATMAVSGAESGLQQAYTNIVTGQPATQNVLSESIKGAAFAGALSKASTALKVEPKNTVGRPVIITKDRSLSQSLTKNSLTAIVKNTFSDILNTTVKIFTGAFSGLFSNNDKK